jgi:hypothetical protein
MNPNKKRVSSNFDKGGKISNTPKVFVADLAAYNEGKLIGEWIDLSEFTSGYDVMDKISELLEKWSEKQGVEREEYIVLGFENFPDNIYSEYMGENEFEEVIYYYESINNSDFDFEVVNKYMNLYGINSFKDAIKQMNNTYYGQYASKSEFAEEFIYSLGFNDSLKYYLYVTETDRRLIAQEQAFDYIENLSDDEIINLAGMKDELDLYNERLEETYLLDEEIDNLTEKDTDKIEKLQNEIDEIESLIEKEGDYHYILEKAKKKLYDEIYEEWYEGLKDPYDFLVVEKGLYDDKSIFEANFINIDYEEFAEELEYDFDIIYNDGEYYVFSIN